jgi:hypothetical protein
MATANGLPLVGFEQPADPLPVEEVKEQAARTQAHHVERMLREHLGGAPSKPEPGFFVRELQAPDSMRRADVLWVPLDSQRRGQLWGYEIKVSRSDVITELRDPTKADAWLKYCDRWWLVVADRKHVEGLEVPAHWGILAPPEGRNKRLMTVIRRAPDLQPVSRDAAFTTILSRLFYGGDTVEAELRDLRSKLKYADDVRKQMQGEQDRLERRIVELGGFTRGVDEGQVERLVQAILTTGKARGVSVWNLNTDDVVAAVTDHIAFSRIAKQAIAKAQFVLNQLERIVASDVSTAADALRAALGPDADAQ